MKKLAFTLFILLIGLVAIFALTRQNTETSTANPDASELVRSEEMQQFFLTNAAERDAICSDGSTPTYYVRQGAGDNTDKWIIHLKGGGDCSSEAECKQRRRDAEDLVSSKPWGPTLTVEGIMDFDETKNPDFHDFNHVYAIYCSSDNWAGDNTVQVGRQDFHFKGRNIVTALLEDLQDDTILPTPNLSEASEVLFTGSSAGGSGINKNLDFVADSLSHAEVKGVSDGSWSVTSVVGGYQGNAEDARASLTEDEIREIATARQIEVVEEFHNTQMDASCVEANTENAWACSGSIFAYDYYTTPLFVYKDQHDPITLTSAGVSKPFDNDELLYISGYADAMIEEFQGIEFGFSTRQTAHTALTKDQIHDLEIDGYTYYDILTNWYFDRSGPTKLVEEK